MPPLVWVEWTDSSSSNHWCSPDDITPPSDIRSLGWVIKDTPEFLSITTCYTDDPHVARNFGSSMTIPKGAIRAYGELTGIWK